MNTDYRNHIPWSPPQTPFISCRTKRGWFRAGRKHPGSGDPDERASKQLLLSSDKVGNDRSGGCGVIEPHTAIDTLLADSADGQMTVELVAICAQVLRSHGIFHDYSWHKVYGVLWIEWVDSVAYRKGSGLVDKKVWETHDLEDVDLVLG